MKTKSNTPNFKGVIIFNKDTCKINDIYSLPSYIYKNLFSEIAETRKSIVGLLQSFFYHDANMENLLKVASLLYKAGIVAASPKTVSELGKPIIDKGSGISIFIQGERGSGKESLAKLYYQYSDNGVAGKGEYIPTNCAAIMETLFESELFGYKKGSHREADEDKNGLIKTANNGALFLDEIAEMPMTIQAKFLRFLNDGEYRPLGASKNETSNAMIISATNANLSKKVKDGLFRADLYDRISGIQVYIPNLKVRSDGDKKALVEHFLTDHIRDSQDSNIRLVIPQDLYYLLWSVDYSGNIREMRNRCHDIANNTELQNEYSAIENLKKAYIQSEKATIDNDVNQKFNIKLTSKREKHLSHWMIEIHKTFKDGNHDMLENKISEFLKSEGAWIESILGLIGIEPEINNYDKSISKYLTTKFEWLKATTNLDNESEHKWVTKKTNELIEFEIRFILDIEMDWKMKYIRRFLSRLSQGTIENILKLEKDEVLPDSFFENKVEILIGVLLPDVSKKFRCSASNFLKTIKREEMIVETTKTCSYNDLLNVKDPVKNKREVYRLYLRDWIEHVEHLNENLGKNDREIAESLDMTRDKYSKLKKESRILELH